MKRKILQFIIVYSIIIIPFLSAQATVNPIYRQCDSIMRKLPRLSAKAKLDALMDRCNLALYQNKMEFELRCLNDYIDEAHRQNDSEKEAWGRYNRLCCYLNYGQRHKLESELPEDLDFCADHNSWLYYFDMRYNLIKAYIGDEKYLTALQELKHIYADANKRNINYGRGIALSAMGQCYMNLYNIDEAQKCFKEAVRLLPYHSSVLYDSYGYYFMLLKNKPADLMKAAKDCLKKIDEYVTRNSNHGDASPFASVYMYCYDAIANAEMTYGHLAKAKGWLDKTTTIANKLSDGSKQSIINDWIRFFELTKNYPKALQFAAEKVRTTHDCSKAYIISAKEQYAHVLFLAGKGMESAAIYDKLVEVKDSLNNMNNTRQLNEMSTIYGLDKEILEHRNTQLLLYGAIVCIILLIIIIMGTILYLRHLRKKNRQLYLHNEELEKAKQKIEDITAEKDPKNMEPDEYLYQRLCKLMKEKQIYKNPDASRELLANELGTNFTYIADAIRKYSNGNTVSDFINQYRLRYAVQKLKDKAPLAINEICFDSGFNSYNTFFRLFREKYGVSPSVYQQLSKEND